MAHPCMHLTSQWSWHDIRQPVWGAQSSKCMQMGELRQMNSRRAGQAMAPVSDESISRTSLHVFLVATRRLAGT